MPTIRATIHDRATGRPLEARVYVLASTGQFHAPDGAILKVGGGEPFFFADRAFALDIPRGQADIVVERGTEYRPLRQTVEVPASGTLDLDLGLDRWIRTAERGWYAGNTHVHYSEQEIRPLDRIRLDPRVEDLPVLIVSILRRRELAYASNTFSVGHHHLSTPDHVIDIGEETRHNDEPFRIGFGHIMLVNLKKFVEPVSRGILVDDSSPDYPPLVDACDLAHGQGGTVIWCHNANGMEAPIAAALGRIDALNLFDPYWMDPEYDLWYALLNCGIRLPASTGSDWFVCSANRVYVDVGHSFSYESWLAGLRAGRTVVTNGPLLRLTVDGHAPSNNVLDVRSDRRVRVNLEWESAVPLDRVEIVRDGEVVARATPAADGEPFTRSVREEHTASGSSVRVDVNIRTRVSASPATNGQLQVDVDGADTGWIAARAWGRHRDSYGHAMWAHTSPVYLRNRPVAARARASAAIFRERIDRATGWIGASARFDDVAQRDRTLQLFADGRAFYEGLARE